MKWPPKQERERLEIEGFIEAYQQLPHGKRLTICVKGEKPDYILQDSNGKKIGVELTSVYLNDRSVPDSHLPEIEENETYPNNEGQIPLYLERLATAVHQKIRLARSGYNLENPLVLSVYVNEYVSIFMTKNDWEILVQRHYNLFHNLHPFSEVVFWKLANNHLFFVNSSGSHFVENSCVMRKTINGIMGGIRFLWFLLLHEKKYKSFLSKSWKVAIFLFFALLGLDLLKITPAGAMSSEKQWGIRIIGLLLIFVSWLLSFSIHTFKYFKKYKNPDKLTDEELNNFLEHMNESS